MSEENNAAEWLPQTLEEIVTLHADTARKAAGNAERRNGLLKADDIEQEIWMHVAANIAHYVGRDAKTVAGFFRKVADQVIHKERIDYMHFSRSYVYSPKDVRKALTSSVWSLIEEAPDIDARIDIRAAHAVLPPARKAAVFRHYGLKVPLEDMSATETSAVYRGVDAMTVWLNLKAKNFSTPIHLVTEGSH